MQKEQFLKDEVEFYKKRVEQLRAQLANISSLNQSLSKQISTADKISEEYFGLPKLDTTQDDNVSTTSNQATKKLTSSTYNQKIAPFLAPNPPLSATTLSESQQALVDSLYTYQMSQIQSLQSTLNKRDTALNKANNALMSQQKNAAKIEKLEISAKLEKEELIRKLERTIEEEKMVKSRAIYYGVGPEKEALIATSSALGVVKVPQPLPVPISSLTTSRVSTPASKRTNTKSIGASASKHMLTDDIGVSLRLSTNSTAGKDIKPLPKRKTTLKSEESSMNIQEEKSITKTDKSVRKSTAVLAPMKHPPPI